MKKSHICRIIVFILLSVSSFISFAWDHSIELGYGLSHDPNHTKYNNAGFLLTGDLLPLKHTSWTYWSLNGALGQWYSTAPHNKNLTTAALALALRFYPSMVDNRYPSYLLGSVGPAYLSNRQFGANTQAGNLTIQFNAGFGVEFNQFDINLRMSHYSNAYLARPDHGFTVLYLLSIGYLF